MILLSFSLDQCERVCDLDYELAISRSGQLRNLVHYIFKYLYYLNINFKYFQWRKGHEWQGKPTVCISM